MRSVRRSNAALGPDPATRRQAIAADALARWGTVPIFWPPNAQNWFETESDWRAGVLQLSDILWDQLQGAAS